MEPVEARISLYTLTSEFSLFLCAHFLPLLSFSPSVRFPLSISNSCLEQITRTISLDGGNVQVPVVVVACFVGCGIGILFFVFSKWSERPIYFPVRLSSSSRRLTIPALCLFMLWHVHCLDIRSRK